MTADQLHLRPILLLPEGNAQSRMQQLRSGADSATLAEQYDPITRGDLGWFPRGYLVQPKVEEAAFTLQPGGVSDVIHTDAGYHIIQVIERDANHTLTPDAYATLQHVALQQWIQDRIQASEVETYIQ
jgi:peptidyl-prolyl cis-trans isomerase C